jgi:hypothetical protein
MRGHNLTGRCRTPEHYSLTEGQFRKFAEQREPVNLISLVKPKSGLSPAQTVDEEDIKATPSLAFVKGAS